MPTLPGNLIPRCCPIVGLLLGVLATVGLAQPPSTQPVAPPTTAPSTTGPRVLFDFEAGPLSASWRAVGPIVAERTPIPGTALPTPLQAPMPGGHGLSVATDDSSRLIATVDIATGSEPGFVALWIHRPPQEVAARATTVFDLWLIEADGRCAFRRRVDVSHVGWSQVVLPTRWFRWEGGRVPRWADVRRLELRFRHAATLTFDAITVLPTNATAGVSPSEDDMAAMAFRARERETVRIARRPGVRVIAGDSPLDIERIADAMAELVERLHRDLPLPPEPTKRQPATLLILPDEAHFHAFVARLAAQFNGIAETPTASGLTMQGIAASTFHAGYEEDRPVYTHEFVHAYLARNLRLPNRQEWLQEGIATHYQLLLHPQDDFDAIVRAGLRHADRRLPLAELCDGEPIPLQRYWQAKTVVAMLMTDEAFAGRFDDLLAAMLEAGSTDLGPHLQSTLGMDWAAFERHWRRFCVERYEPPSVERDGKPQPSAEPQPSPSSQPR